MDFLSILRERGFVHQATDFDGLQRRLSEFSTNIYIGFDLTAPSLHVGSLIQLMVLRWAMRCGHVPHVLVGEATTRVGDPTGKDRQRPLLSLDEIERNRVGISRAIDQVLSPVSDRRQMVSNLEWFREFDFLGFMREFGPMFSVNRMLTLDSVRSRLERTEPMTMLEMVYPMMQAVDFYRMFLDHGVHLQVGGSDQWGNIIGGVDLVRRMSVSGAEVFGLTTPLLTNAVGEKMGKTTGGAIWLDPKLTSPFDFWQFWRNVEDEKVGEFLGLFTELDMGTIEGLRGLTGAGINEAKKILATEVCTIVHGREAALAAQTRAEEVFEAKANGAANREVVLTSTPGTIADILVHLGAVSSKGQADRLAQGGGIRVDGVQITDARMLPPSDEFVLAVGKKNSVAVRIQA